MRSDQLHSITVLGSGESGMGAVRLARKHNIDVFVSDAGKISTDAKSELKSLGVDFEEKKHSIEKIKSSDVIVKSPGIPNTASLIVELRALGKEVISEIEFAFHFTDAKIVGITGSNGKTTTTLLTTHLLKAGGLNVVSAGNVGNSFSGLLVDEQPDIVVLELSSFQLDDIIDFKADVSMLLNITPDHLDRYEYSIEKYAAAKFNLLNNVGENDVIIANLDDEAIAKRLSSQQGKILPVSVKQKMKSGAYLDQDYLVFDTDKDIEVLSKKILPLIGVHNDYNQMMAVLTAIELDVDLKSIISGLASFQNAAHRMEFVSEIEGVDFVNDSKATNVDAVYYALDAMDKPVIWIAGGVNKGNDYDQILDLVKKKVVALICLGKDNQHLIDAFENNVGSLIEVKSAKEAVSEAYRIAEEGEVVLLSPACASFDLFTSYENRGDLFKTEIEALKDVQLKSVKL
ncbi:MAG: UDP-N-acetylmuramoyl-L-alanine--D-glutamate ligase [Reichenbachiella sp.]